MPLRAAPLSSKITSPAAHASHPAARAAAPVRLPLSATRSSAFCGSVALCDSRASRAATASSSVVSVSAMMDGMKSAAKNLGTLKKAIDGNMPVMKPLDKLKTVIVTGASSGLGKSTVRALAEEGGWYIVLACRNVEKAQEVAEELGLSEKSHSVMALELSSLESVRNFHAAFKKTGRQIDCLCCNAAIYLPNQPEPSWTEEGYEMSMGVNHLSHFLLVNLFIPDLAKSKKSPRCIIVGSITGNTNTVGGGAVYPFADLGELQGYEGASAGKDVAMMDGGDFDGAKAYKDSKLANMMTVLELHRRYNASTGITFGSMYPGCIAETALFRQKRGWFRWFFPIFMKYVTGGYVSEEEAGDRLAAVISSPDCSDSGVYWSWNGGAKTVGWYDFAAGNVRGAGGAGGKLFANTPSGAVRDPVKAKKLWEVSEKAVGLA